MLFVYLVIQYVLQNALALIHVMHLLTVDIKHMFQICETSKFPLVYSN